MHSYMPSPVTCKHLANFTFELPDYTIMAKNSSEKSVYFKAKDLVSYHCFLRLVGLILFDLISLSYMFVTTSLLPLGWDSFLYSCHLRIVKIVTPCYIRPSLPCRSLVGSDNKTEQNRTSGLLCVYAWVTGHDMK